MKIVTYKEDTWDTKISKQDLVSFVNDKLSEAWHDGGRIESTETQVDNIITFLSKLTETLCDKGILKTADLRRLLGKQLIKVRDE